MFARDLLEKANNRNAWIRKVRIDGEAEATEFVDERQRAEFAAMKQSIRDKVHRQYIVWLRSFLNDLSANVLGAAASSPPRDLEIRKPVLPAKALEVHVFICGFGFALVHDVKPFAAVSRVVLREYGEPRDRSRVLRFLCRTCSRGDRRLVRMIAQASR